MRSESEAPDKAVQRVTCPSLWRSAARAGWPRHHASQCISCSRPSLAFGEWPSGWAFVEPDRRGHRAPPSVAAPASSAPLVSARDNYSQPVAKAVTEAAATTGTPRRPRRPLRLRLRGRRDRKRRAASLLWWRPFGPTRAPRRGGPKLRRVVCRLRRRVSDGWYQVISGRSRHALTRRTRSNASVSPGLNRHADCAARSDQALVLPLSLLSRVVGKHRKLRPQRTGEAC